MKSKEKWLIGIDEAGRGALAGPVSVGFIAIPFSALKSFESDLLRDFDSKKISPKKREAIYGWIKKDLGGRGVYSDCALVGPKVIEVLGIVEATNIAIRRMFQRFKILPELCEVKLDRGLCAPKKYISQNSYTKGDSLYSVIGLASIMAKVRRDKYMVQKAKNFPMYGFGVHKGYGTKSHRKTILKYGTSSLHRKSWCRGCFDEK